MIKYDCEKCGRTVFTEEAIGADVYLDNTKGTSFTFTDFIGGKITITYEDANVGLQQFCHACMFETIVQCLREKFPEEELIKLMGFATRLLGPRRTSLQEANAMAVEGMQREFARQAKIHEDYAGPAADFNVPNSLPEGDLYGVLTDDNVTDPGDPSQSQELSQLYAEGQLPEPRSDFATQEPTRTCNCRRDTSFPFRIVKEPGCPVHSPGGSTGPG